MTASHPLILDVVLLWAYVCRPPSNSAVIFTRRWCCINLTYLLTYLLCGVCVLKFLWLTLEPGGARSASANDERKWRRAVESAVSAATRDRARHRRLFSSRIWICRRLVLHTQFCAQVARRRPFDAEMGFRSRESPRTVRGRCRHSCTGFYRQFFWNLFITANHMCNKHKTIKHAIKAKDQTCTIKLRIKRARSVVKLKHTVDRLWKNTFSN